MFFIFSLGLVGCAMSVRGSGNVATEERQVSSFDRISLDGFGELILTQGGPESVRIEAEENLMPYIKTDVKGDELVISIKSRRPLVPSRAIKFYVSVPDIEAISLNGAGMVQSERIVSDVLDLTIDGTGNITIDELEADRMMVDIDGLGDLDISGRVVDQEVDIDGAGNFDGRHLESENAVIHIDGLGSADISVTDSLDVDINGSGRVKYSGDPVVHQQINGLGQISKR